MRAQGLYRNQVHWHAEQLAQFSFETHQLQQSYRVGKADREVDITAWLTLTAHYRAKDAQGTDAVLKAQLADALLVHREEGSGGAGLRVH